MGVFLTSERLFPTVAFAVQTAPVGVLTYFVTAKSIVGDFSSHDGVRCSGGFLFEPSFPRAVFTFEVLSLGVRATFSHGGIEHSNGSSHFPTVTLSVE